MPEIKQSLSPHESQETLLLTDTVPAYSLVVWNDDVNTFDWVIDALVDICGHSPEQAEQCAVLIHTRGKYAVKNGSLDDLKPQCQAISNRKIWATIESTD